MNIFYFQLIEKLICFIDIFSTYFVVASRMVRPGQIYKISVSILKARLKMTVRASISNNGVEVTHVNEEVKQGIPETLIMKV